MWLLRCIRNGHCDPYSRSGGGGMLGGVIYKDSKVGPKRFAFLPIWRCNASDVEAKSARKRNGWTR